MEPVTTSSIATVAMSTAPKPKPSAAAPGSKYGHADDYTWISGQVQYSRLSKSWRLRYAPVDQVDAYGGSVTPVWDVDDKQLENLQDGQFIRVQGRMQDVEAKTPAPRYRVSSVYMLEDKN